MKVRNLNNEIVDWKVTGSEISSNKSSLHIKARQLIKELFPTSQVMEEVPISPRRGETLYLDFFLPLQNKCIEVHGEQHYNFNPHFHGTLMSFMKHKKRDREKKEWCSLNDITYIELPYDKDLEEWKKIIQL